MFKQFIVLGEKSNKSAGVFAINFIHHFQTLKLILGRYSDSSNKILQIRVKISHDRFIRIFSNSHFINQTTI